MVYRHCSVKKGRVAPDCGYRSGLELVLFCEGFRISEYVRFKLSFFMVNFWTNNAGVDVCTFNMFHWSESSFW